MQRNIITGFAICLVFLSSTAQATDHSMYLNKEPIEMHGSAHNASEGEQTAFRNEWQAQFVQVPSEKRTQYAWGNWNTANLCHQGFIEEHLNLHGRQYDRFIALKNKYAVESGFQRKAIARLNRKLSKEALKKKPDRKRIAEISEKIGNRHATIARMRGEHFQKIGKVLNDKQRKKFFSLVKTMQKTRDQYRSMQF